MVATLYGLFLSTTASAILGSLAKFFCLTRPTAVLTRMVFWDSSTSTHVGVTWGDPSSMRVATYTRFLSVKSGSMSLDSVLLAAFLSFDLHIFCWSGVFFELIKIQFCHYCCRTCPFASKCFMTASRNVCVTTGRIL